MAVQAHIKHERKDVMAKSLAHTKYICKYHIVFIPKFQNLEGK